MTHDQTTPAPVEVTQERAVMDALWPLLGGNHTEAELWGQIAEAVETALARHRIAHSTPAGEVVPVLRWEGDTLWLGEQRIGWFHVTPLNECQVVCSLIGILSAPTPTEARTEAEQAVRDWLARAGLYTHPAPPADVVEFVTILHQYRSDMKHPPTPDSRERRVAMIDAAIAKFGRDA